MTRPPNPALLTDYALIERVEKIRGGCLDCDQCTRQCNFLAAAGTPGSIAGSIIAGSLSQRIAFKCSLCGLCSSVCPAGLDPCAMFLDLRRDCHRDGHSPFPEHTRLLDYERRGISPRFSWYGLPQNCDTVFFPGCTFAGTRPALTHKVFSTLSKAIPNLGVVLDCCSKPSHDIGLEAAFTNAFSEMRNWLLERGVKRVLTVCPSCHVMFERYGDGLTPSTVYEHLAALPLPTDETGNAVVTVHDPCVLRAHQGVQNAVRTLTKRIGCRIQEMPHHGSRTLCCGEGGATSLIHPELGQSWTNRRTQEAAGRPIVTFCAGCVNMLSKQTPTMHILDLIYTPQLTLLGSARVSNPPFTYLNRLGLKRRLRRELSVIYSRSRQEMPDS